MSASSSASSRSRSKSGAGHWSSRGSFDESSTPLRSEINDSSTNFLSTTAKEASRLDNLLPQENASPANRLSSPKGLSIAHTYPSPSNSGHQQAPETFYLNFSQNAQDEEDDDFFDGADGSSSSRPKCCRCEMGRFFSHCYFILACLGFLVMSSITRIIAVLDFTSTFIVFSIIVASEGAYPNVWKAFVTELRDYSFATSTADVLLLSLVRSVILFFAYAYRNQLSERASNTAFATMIGSVVFHGTKLLASRHIGVDYFILYGAAYTVFEWLAYMFFRRRRVQGTDGERLARNSRARGFTRGYSLHRNQADDPYGAYSSPATVNTGNGSRVLGDHSVPGSISMVSTTPSGSSVSSTSAIVGDRDNAHDEEDLEIGSPFSSQPRRVFVSSKPADFRGSVAMSPTTASSDGSLAYDPSSPLQSHTGSHSGSMASDGSSQSQNSASMSPSPSQSQSQSQSQSNATTAKSQRKDGNSQTSVTKSLSYAASGLTTTFVPGLTEVPNQTVLSDASILQLADAETRFASFEGTTVHYKIRLSTNILPAIENEKKLDKNGHNAHEAETGAETGPAFAPIVVLFHGFGGGVFSFSQILDKLTANASAVIVFDQPGFGLTSRLTQAEVAVRSQAFQSRSQKLNRERERIEQSMESSPSDGSSLPVNLASLLSIVSRFADDPSPYHPDFAIRFASAIIQHYSLPARSTGLVFVGHHSGAMVAIRSALTLKRVSAYYNSFSSLSLRALPKLHGLALLSPCVLDDGFPAVIRSLFRTKVGKNLIKQLLRSEVEEVALKRGWFDPKRIPLEILHHLKGFSNLPNWVEGLMNIASLPNETEVIESFLPTITCPISLVYGEHDKITVPASVLKLARTFTGSASVSLVKVPLCGHHPHQEQPEITAVSLANFITLLPTLETSGHTRFANELDISYQQE